jgi:spermidine synthase
MHDIIRIAVLLALGAALVCLRRHIVKGRGARELFSAWLDNHWLIVRQTREHRELVLRYETETIQNRVDKTDPVASAWPYIDGFRLAFAFVPNMERVAFIGAGAAVSPRQFLRESPNLVADVVEIEPQVLAVAEQFFQLSGSDRLSLNNADGREFLLAQPSQKYGAIILDVCDDGGIPHRLFTTQFFSLVRDRLKADGVLLVNVLGSLRGPQSGLVKTIAHTLEDAFGSGHSLVVPVPSEEERKTSIDRRLRRNILLVAKARGLRVDDAVLDYAQRLGLPPPVAPWSNGGFGEDTHDEKAVVLQDTDWMSNVKLSTLLDRASLR